MKLLELAAIHPTKQAAKVFESYFGGRVQLDTITPKQARSLLTRVRGLVKEHRRTPEFHSSEQNPSYLKLMMMEQVLAAKVKEDATVGIGQPAGATANQTTSTTPVDPVKQKQEMQQKINSTQDPALKAALTKSAAGQSLSPAEQLLVTGAAVATQNESRRSRQRRLREASEIQQAQVVLASQDMVDQVQKMSEQVSSMQFKDLPALVDQIRNEVGADQATQFNGDASAALSGLLQNLQGAKQQLEAALGVVTGQAPQVPGEDIGGELPAPTEEMPAELPAPEDDVDAEMDANLGVPKASLGRGRR